MPSATLTSPASPATFRLDGGDLLPRMLSETRVLFDGDPSPLIFTSSGQVSAIAPYSLAGKFATTLQVEYRGVPTAALTLPVAPSSPALFTLDSSGRGAGAVLNQDYSVNTPANPAAIGSVIMLFATGEGQTSPQVPDGKIASPPQ